MEWARKGSERRVYLPTFGNTAEEDFSGTREGQRRSIPLLGPVRLSPMHANEEEISYELYLSLFNAAAKSIQVKVFNDDDDSNTVSSTVYFFVRI